MDSGLNIESKIEKIMQDAIEIARMDVVEKLEIMWENSIDRFYDSYDPSWYRRTHSTYKASDAFDSLENHLFNPTDKNGYEIGIHISSDNIGDPYDAESEWVFKRTFEKGYHGYTIQEADEWSRYKVSIVGADGKRYTVHSWKKPPRKRLQKMKVLKPTPKADMDTKFKKFKKNELKEVVKDAFVEAIENNL